MGPEVRDTRACVVGFVPSHGIVFDGTDVRSWSVDQCLGRNIPVPFVGAGVAKGVFRAPDIDEGVAQSHGACVGTQGSIHAYGEEVLSHENSVRSLRHWGKALKAGGGITNWMPVSAVDINWLGSYLTQGSTSLPIRTGRQTKVYLYVGSLRSLGAGQTSTCMHMPKICVVVERFLNKLEHLARIARPLEGLML